MSASRLCPPDEVSISEQEIKKFHHDFLVMSSVPRIRAAESRHAKVHRPPRTHRCHVPRGAQWSRCCGVRCGSRLPWPLEGQRRCRWPTRVIPAQMRQFRLWPAAGERAKQRGVRVDVHSGTAWYGQFFRSSPEEASPVVGQFESDTPGVGTALVKTPSRCASNAISVASASVSDTSSRLIWIVVTPTQNHTDTALPRTTSTKAGGYPACDRNRVTCWTQSSRDYPTMGPPQIGRGLVG